MSIKSDPLGCKAKLAYIPDDPQLYDYMTGIQYLNFVGDIFAVTAADRRELWAKLQLHLAVVGVPALVFAGCLCWALEAGALEGALTLVLALGASLLAGEAGLAANLKLPNLTWTNETYPVKQGASVAVTLFGGWGLVAALGGAWFLVGQALGTAGFLALAGALVLGACLGLWAWLGCRGAEIFANLG